MNRTSLLASMAVSAMLITGCASTAAEPPPAAGPSALHTMPDGTVMSDSEMADMPGMTHDHDHDHGSGPDASASPEPVGPSPAARMVCSGDVVADVSRILALDTEPAPTSAWAQPMFTCTYQLRGGPLVLSVHDATDEAAGKQYFADLRTELGDTEELRGMYGLGLPAYETDDGTVVFIRDGKTLQVDATALPDKLGPDHSMSQTDLAYAVATSVLACWTEHA